MPVAEGRTLGTVLRAARTKAGLTQAALAKAIGLAPNHILRIESGERLDIRFSTACKLAQALDLPLDMLATACGFPTQSGSQAGPAVEGLLHAVRRAKAAAEGMARAAEAAAEDIGASRASVQKRPSAKAKRRR